MEKWFLNAAYKSKQNKTEEKGLKILTPKQMLQRLPIALAQVKAGNTLKTCLMKSVKSYIFCFKKKNKLKEYITT